MFKKLNIGKKLVIFFVIVAIIASIAGIVSTTVLKTTDTAYSDALIEYGFSQGDIGKAMLMLADDRSCTRDIVTLTEEKNITSAGTGLADAQAKYKTYAETVLKKLDTDEEKTIYQKIETAFAGYQSVQSRVLDLAKTTNEVQKKEARQLMLDELDPAYDAVYQAYAELMDHTVNTGNTLSTDLTNESNRSLLICVALIIAAMGAAVLLGVRVSRSISRPVKACADRLVEFAKGDLHSSVPKKTAEDETGVMLDSLSEAVTKINGFISDLSFHLGKMAEGDLTTEVTLSYIGDFGPMKTSLQKISSSFNDAMSGIGQAADQVANGSDQVSGSAQALSQGATEQASSVEELSASIAEISDQVRSNAESAANVNSIAIQVGQEIENGDRQMKELVSAIADINDASAEINKIIKTIDDIAFQTNILALNAAVEAARVGAAGKGFAVVADEVRNLAGKSADAVKVTTDLIENSIRAVEHGTRMADDTANALDKITSGAKRITGLIGEISASSNEQATSISQVNLGVEQISGVVQTNSATAEESAAASEELSGQAQTLQGLVGRFRLKGSDAAIPMQDFSGVDLDAFVQKSNADIGSDKY